MFAEAHDRAAGHERVGGDAEAGLGESGLDARSQAKKGCEFAVLLDALVGKKIASLACGLGGRVFDELAAEGNGQPAGIDDLGFEHGVKEGVAGGVAVVEAMGTVALVEAQESRAVNREHELPVEPAGIEHLLQKPSSGVSPAYYRFLSCRLCQGILRIVALPLQKCGRFQKKRQYAGLTLLPEWIHKANSIRGALGMCHIPADCPKICQYYNPKD